MRPRSSRAAGLIPVVLSVMLVGACSSSAPTDQPASASAGPADPSLTDPGPSIGPSAGLASPICTHQLRVGLVGEPGSLTDNGFNQAAVAGLGAAAQAAPTCFQTDSVATKTVDDATADLKGYAEGGEDIVIGVGQVLGDTLGDTAASNPGVHFIGIDAAPGPTHDSSWSTNGQSLFFAEDEQGYMAGVLAALLSHNRSVGVVGGLLVVPQVEASVEGFLHGASATVPGIAVQFTYATSFTDPAQGRAAAAAMVAKGADVIFSTGSATGDGALLAACKAGVLAIGSDTDQALTLPAAAGCIVSSAMKNVTAALTAALLRVASGPFRPGFHTDDASTGGIMMAPGHDLAGDISPADQDHLESALQGLADGSLRPAVVIDGKTP